MADYSKFSLHRLHSALAKAEKEEDAHYATTPEVGEEAAHTNALKLIQQKVSDIDDEIARREEKEAKAKAAQVNQVQPTVVSTGGGGGGLSNGRLQVQIKLVENAISELKTFGSGDEVSTFVRDIKNKAHLANCDDTKAYMLNRLFTRLSPEYQTRYVAHVKTNSITTIDGFVAYIKETYSSCKSIFQHFELLDNFEMSESENSLRDYASRLQNEIFEIETVIDAKYATVAKKKNTSSDGVLEKSALYKLLTGMVFLRTLKKDRELYNHVISRIDDCLDATEIANIAEAFKERKQTDDPLLSNLAPAVNHVKGGKSQKNGGSRPCFFNFDGLCDRGDNCRFDHGQFSQAEVNAHGYEKWKMGRIGQNGTDGESGKDPERVNFLRGAGTFHF